MNFLKMLEMLKLYLLRKQSNVSTRVFQCCALNGGVFLLSILFFDYGLMPVLELIVQSLMGQSAVW